MSYAKVVSLSNDPGTEKRLFMKELVNYKDVSKNQREVWGSSRLVGDQVGLPQNKIWY